MSYSEHPWSSREEALRLILGESRFTRRIETIPTREALGRVTAKEVTAINTLPNSLTSRMDGVAIRSDCIAGGIPDTRGWREGSEYVFSNTGVGIPDGYDTVVLIEDIEFDDSGAIHIKKAPVKGQNVNAIGSKLKSGVTLIPEHFFLDPVHLGLLVTGGVMQVEVLAKPRIAILPTGNELVPAGETPPRGKNVESNGIMIEAQVALMGAESRLYPITPDDPEKLEKVIRDALGWADIVILNGGTSKGTDDRSIEVLEKIGRVLVYEMDYGPGKHTTMTVAEGKPIVGTVGPTVGAEYAVDWYVAPLVSKYLCLPVVEPRRLNVKLEKDMEVPPRFGFYARMNVRKTEDGYLAERLDFSSSFIDQMTANAYIRVSSGRQGYKAGDTVEVILRRPLEWI